jgi:hypothetical protein
MNFKNLFGIASRLFDQHSWFEINGFCEKRQLFTLATRSVENIQHLQETLKNY